MNQNAICVGIDVDDVQQHGPALDRHTGEVVAPSSIPRRACKRVKTDRSD